jgi:hypothetical protein
MVTVVTVGADSWAKAPLEARLCDNLHARARARVCVCVHGRAHEHCASNALG